MRNDRWNRKEAENVFFSAMAEGSPGWLSIYFSFSWKHHFTVSKFNSISLRHEVFYLRYNLIWRNFHSKCHALVLSLFLGQGVAVLPRLQLVACLLQSPKCRDDEYRLPCQTNVLTEIRITSSPFIHQCQINWNHPRSLQTSRPCICFY